MRAILLISALTLGCRTKNPDKTDDGALDTAGLEDVDLDGDGYPASEDCDDEDAAVHPGAIEVCDGVDNDCDDGVDEDVTSTWYADADDDSYGDATSSTESCSEPAGHTANPNDCDDSRDDVHPGSVEFCDGVDNDCDGLVDEDDAFEWHPDTDGDGFGDPDETVVDCAELSGYVLDRTDCDDTTAAANPDAEEICDKIDNDCDGEVDEGATTTWYEDGDGDGYGDPGRTDEACDAPVGYAGEPGDCDDADPSVNPGATEVCNGVDDDCDGAVDGGDAGDVVDWYADADGDGYGDPGSSVAACDPPTGYTDDASDCDDGEAAVHPGASEICNAVDDDCDGLVDDADGGVDLSTGGTWYTDGDGDGYGDAAAARAACSQPSGTVADASDCDDGDAAVNPAASEVCNSVDDDCDGAVDDADPSLVTSTGSTWYRDADSDGYGDPSSSKQACTRPSGSVANDDDCDDRDAAVNPAATEVCNSVDDDCDGAVDDADGDLDTGTTSTWYEDGDLDGYGDAGSSTTACAEPSGYTDDDTDCDDSDADRNPGATEACNGIDDDCDGVADSSSVCPCYVHYYASYEHPYMFCTSTAAWTTAQANCGTYDYHLLTIGDAGENSWADSTADTYSTAKWWMGFNDRGSEGTWVWENGSAVTYTNWYSGEPNDAGGNEDCGQLNRYHPSEAWNDEPCSSTFAYVCEAD